MQYDTKCSTIVRHEINEKELKKKSDEHETKTNFSTKVGRSDNVDLSCGCCLAAVTSDWQILLKRNVVI